VVNALGLAMMGFDKISAKAGSERVPELWFFLVSLVGGFIGTILGIFFFHHKTMNLSFQVKIVAAGAISFLIMAILLGL